MGVVRKQSIGQNITEYLGVAIGMLNQLIIYPYTMTLDVIGTRLFLIETATFLTPFIVLGFAPMTIRFFPRFRNEHNGHNGFLTFVLGGPMIVFTSLLLLYLLLREPFVKLISKFTVISEYSKFYEYSGYIFGLVFGMSLTIILINYLSNFGKTIVTSLISNFIVKVGTGAVALLYFFKYLTIKQMYWSTVGVYLISLSLMVIYILSIGQWKINFRFKKFITGDLKKEMKSVFYFGLLSNFTAPMISKLDSIMISGLLGMTQNGIFSIPQQISNAMEIPRRTVSIVAAPIMTDYYAKGMMTELNSLFKRTALNIFAIGLFLLITVWGCIDQLYQIIPNGDRFISAKILVLIFGISILIDMITGLNEELLTYSSLYKINFFFHFIFGLSNIAILYLFIKGTDGIIGVALANITLKILWNTAKSLTIWNKYRIQPFSINMVWLIVCAVLIYFASTFIDVGNKWANIILKSGFIGVTFFGSVYLFKIVNDLNNFIDLLLGKVGIVLRKKQ